MIKYDSEKINKIVYYKQTGVKEFSKSSDDIVSSYCNEEFPFFLHDDNNNPFKTEHKYRLRLVNLLE